MLLFALGERVWRMVDVADSPVADAEWIWAPAPEEQAVPSAFYAVRDFDLPARPVEARLWVQGDEEYVVFVNGDRLGSNRYHASAPLDLYDATALLHAGVNRLHAEVRSTWGKGGFLLSLQVRYADGDEVETVVVSDEAWSIVEQHDLGLVRGWSRPAEAKVPLSWGRPPTGRWGSPSASAQVSPILDDRPSKVQPATAILPHPRFSHVVTLDWGEVVEGYLELDLEIDEGALPWGVLYFSETPPRTNYRAPDAELVAVSGALTWRDVRPRSFRYLQVLGLREISAARVITVEGGAMPTLHVSTPDSANGLFDLDVPRRLRPVPEYVARQIGREPGPLAHKGLR